MTKAMKLHSFVYDNSHLWPPPVAIFLAHWLWALFDNEIGKFFYEDMECPRRTQP